MDIPVLYALGHKEVLCFPQNLQGDVIHHRPYTDYLDLSLSSQGFKGYHPTKRIQGARQRIRTLFRVRMNADGFFPKVCTSLFCTSIRPMLEYCLYVSSFDGHLCAEHANLEQQFF